MTVKREKDRLIVDVHSMRVADAQFRLQTLLASCGADVRAKKIIDSAGMCSVITIEEDAKGAIRK